MTALEEFAKVGAYLMYIESNVGMRGVGVINIICLGLLVGCGQQGPLYLPSQSASAVATHASVSDID